MLHCDIKFFRAPINAGKCGKLRCLIVLQHGIILKMQRLRLSCKLPGHHERRTSLSYGQGYPDHREQELRSLRGWLLCKIAGLDFEEEIVASDDPSTRAELLLLSPSFLVPCLTHDGTKIWDTLAIAEYLNEILPSAGLLPKTLAARARCRSISGEMHSGFSNLRSALPMNLKAHHPGFKIWAGAQADINRITGIWRECFAVEKGPFLFGASPCMADAMFGRW